MRRCASGGDPFRVVNGWRARFVADGTRTTVLGILTGYRPRDLAEGGPEIDVHRAFSQAFPATPLQ